MEMIKIRRHRGSLDQSMLTMKEIPATLEAIREYLNTNNEMPFSEDELSTLQVMPYCGIDNRINWKKTCMVRVNGSVVGFTDSLVT